MLVKILKKKKINNKARTFKRPSVGTNLPSSSPATVLPAAPLNSASGVRYVLSPTPRPGKVMCQGEYSFLGDWLVQGWEPGYCQTDQKESRHPCSLAVWLWPKSLTSLSCHFLS